MTDRVLAEFISRVGTLPYRNPHRPYYKPAVLVWAVNRARLGQGRLVRYVDVADELNALLADLGPPPGEGEIYPWGRLVSNGVWEASTDGKPIDPRRKRPATDRTEGGLKPRYYTALRANPTGALEVLDLLLHRFLDPAQAQAARSRLRLPET